MTPEQKQEALMILARAMAEQQLAVEHAFPFWALPLVFAGLLVGFFYWLRQAKPSTQKRVLNALHAAWQWCYRNGQELVGLPVAMLLFWISGPVLRWLEPNSAIYDAGVLQGITVVICHLLVGNSIARIGARINIVWFQRNTSASIVSREWLFIIYFFGYCLLAALI